MPQANDGAEPADEEALTRLQVENAALRERVAGADKRVAAAAAMQVGLLLKNDSNGPVAYPSSTEAACIPLGQE